MSHVGAIAANYAEGILTNKEHALFYQKQEPHLPRQYRYYLDHYKLMTLAKEIFAEGHQDARRSSGVDFRRKNSGAPAGQMERRMLASPDYEEQLSILFKAARKPGVWNDVVHNKPQFREKTREKVKEFLAKAYLYGWHSFKPVIKE